jgi:hypothetical protein
VPTQPPSNQGLSAFIPGLARKRAQLGLSRGQNLLASAIVAVFMVLLGLALLFGKLPFTRDISPAVNASRAGAQHATGSMLRHLPDGEMCRFTVYDNKKDITVTDRVVRCDDVRPGNEDRRSTQFSWGK